ncbi:MAG: hypothetical protein ABII90_10145 [Bacteroidota bacterium]
MKYRNYIIGITIFLASTFPVHAQDMPDKELWKKMVTADTYLEIRDYIFALKLYLELYEQDSLNPQLNLNIGICLFNLREQKELSKSYFEKVINTYFQFPDAYTSSSVPRPPPHLIEAYYYLGQLYHLDQQFDEAIKAYQFYKNYQGTPALITPEITKEVSDDEIDRYIQISINAKEMLFNPTEVVIENLGEKFNTIYPDYVPVVSADESVLIFTSRREGSTGGLLDPYGEYFEDIYISYKKDDKWTDPEKMPPNINTNTHDACIGLSVDGQMLFIYRTNQDLTGGDIYISDLEGDKWSDPGKLSGSDVNTENLEPSASLSADGNTLYFSSNRPGGYGGKDLYRVLKLPGGFQSLAVNLGPTINTP